MGRLITSKNEMKEVMVLGERGFWRKVDREERRSVADVADQPRLVHTDFVHQEHVCILFGTSSMSNGTKRMTAALVKWDQHNYFSEFSGFK